MKAGKRRLQGDTQREASTIESGRLKHVNAELKILLLVDPFTLKAWFV